MTDGNDMLARVKQLERKDDLTDEEMTEYMELLGALAVTYGSLRVVAVLIDHPELAG